MNSYSFYDDGLAEAMFWYISQDQVYADFCFTQMKEDISIAEYCLLNFEDFKEYCEKNYGFSVIKPHEAS